MTYSLANARGIPREHPIEAGRRAGHRGWTALALTTALTASEAGILYLAVSGLDESDRLWRHGLDALAGTGWDVTSLAAIVLGAVAGAVFVDRVRRLPDPPLPAGRAIRTAMLAMVLTDLAMAGLALLAVLALVRGPAPGLSGFYLAAAVGALPIGVLALVTGPAFRRPSGRTWHEGITR